MENNNNNIVEEKNSENQITPEDPLKLNQIINLQKPEIMKNEEKKEKEPEITPENNQENTPNDGDALQKQNINLGPKRHRRGKNEVSDRVYKCPDCDKSYLSGPALIIHRKTKHEYITETEKKTRGRPKKEDQQDNSLIAVKAKYNEFYNDERRKGMATLDGNTETGNDNIINVEIIKNNFNKIFKHCKAEDLLKNIEQVEDYPFYKLLINNWEKETPDLGKESYTYIIKGDNINVNSIELIQSPPLDDLFFLYLKNFSKKMSSDYFWFVNKYFVLLREFINQTKKDKVKEEYKTEEKKEYTQIFGAELIPECCNDFFLDFMEPKNFFGLNNDELIQLTQHFCFWLYSSKYAHSYLVII